MSKNNQLLVSYFVELQTYFISKHSNIFKFRQISNFSQTNYVFHFVANFRGYTNHRLRKTPTAELNNSAFLRHDVTVFCLQILFDLRQATAVLIINKKQ